MQATRRLLLLFMVFSFAVSWLSSVAQGLPLQFVPVTPCRVVDTRNPDGEFGGPPIQGGTYRNFAIPDNLSCAIPNTAAAYSLNVTVVPHEPLGYLTIWPAGQQQPIVSTLNSLDGRVKSNAAIVPAGASEAVSVFASNTTDVVLDIDGYFAPASGSTLTFYALSPCRVADTRNPNGWLGGPYLQGGHDRDFPILDAVSCDIPSSAQAYSLNFTAVPRGPLGYLTVWPAGQARPVVSTLNAPTGTVTANAAIVPGGDGGDISVYASNDTDLVIDINGYFAAPGSGGLSLYTVAPCRVLDTRNGNGQFSGTIVVDVVDSMCGPSSQAQAYVLNATVVPPGPLGYLTLWPDGGQQPGVSTLNAIDAAITSNMAIVPTNNGKIDAFVSNPTQLILDISSYFALANGAPVVIIGTQPQNQAVVAPASATFTVTAIGTAPIVYQWNEDGTPINGATSATYTTPPTTSADNGASFSVTVANAINRFTSSPAILTVASAPVAPYITVQPQYISVSQGNTASFYVVANGTAPLSYQWSKNGNPISGATSATYTTPPTTLADNNAQFAVTVTNSAGSVPSSAATLAVHSAPGGLGGFQPVYPGDPGDLTGVRYRFQVVTNESQALRLIFGTNILYTPGSPIHYDVESNVYSGTLSFTNDVCATWPQLGEYTEAKASLRNATADYPYFYGQQPAVGSGINTSDPANWPIQTYLGDDLTNFWKSDSISQFGINGIEARLTIERGDTLTDISGFERCGLPMLSGTYRMWIVTTEMTGQGTVVNQVIAPEADARYIFLVQANQIYSEFLNQPGTFTVQYWDFAYIRESDPQWRTVSTFTTMYPYDGSGQDFGMHVVSVGGQDRMEFSNVPGNSYLPGNLPFSIAPQ